jgi:hypothetical protein
MRTKRLFLLTMTLVAVFATGAIEPVSASDQWVAFNGAGAPAAVDVNVPVSDFQEMVADVHTPGMHVTDVSIAGTIYQQLDVTEAGKMTDIGKPELPMIGRYVALPAGATASVEVVDYDATFLDGYNVPPAQAPLPDVEDAERPAFSIDQRTYDVDAYYPAEVARLEGPYVIRGCSVMILQVFPVQFNPIQQRLRVMSNIRIRVSFSDGESWFIDNRLRTPSYAQMFDRLLLNAAEVDSDPQTEAAYEKGNRLLIITHPNFQNAAETLATWKREKGIDTEVRSTIQTGSTASAIQSYIQNAYNTWSPPPTYVLFIGDAEFIPTHYVTTHPYGGIQGRVGTDIYYATVDGTDYFPDISTGRLSVDTLTQANKRVNDIINYERKPITLSSYYNNVAVCAYFQHDSGGYAERRFAQTSEDLAIYFSDSSWLGDYNVDRIYYALSSVYPRYWSTASWNYGGGPAGGPGDPIPSYLRKDISPYFPWNGDSADITAAVNAGRFLVTHRDHGSRSGWGDPYYSTTHVNALTNGVRLPVVWSLNCQTGWFDNETDDTTSTPTTEVNFTEAWERNPNGGAVGLIGATRVSYSGHNDRLCWGFTDAIWPGFLTYSPSSTPFDGPAWEMGPVLNYGKYYYATTYSDSVYRKITFEMFHWYGDPTMQIWTAVPQNLSVTHDAIVPVGTTSLKVSLGACTGALIAISKDGQLLGRVYSTGGTSTINWSTPLVSGDQLLVTVTGHNYRPYQATVDCGGDICECDLDHDGDCDMSDYFFFGEDWGRIDCPITTAALAEPVAANDNESGDPDAAPVEGALAFKQSIAVSNGPDDGRAEPTPPVAAGRGAPGGDIGSRVDPAAPMMSAPIWQRLDNLDPADKQNAVLELEVSADLDPAVRDDVQHAQNLWNSGAYAEAVDAVMDLEADGINMDAGISWKTPKPMPGIEWIDGDVRVSTVENVKETHLDADAQNGNLFAVLLYEDTTGGLWYWTVNFSTDGGATWAETYSWWASYQIKDVSATVVGDYLFVGYVGNTTFDGARLRRIFVSNGQVDLGYGYVTVFDKDVEIKEIALCSNADDSDNRVYYWAILNNFQLVYYWDDTGAISWTEITTGVTDAYAGLDATWNEDDASGYYLYASYVGYVIGGTELTYPVNVVRHGAGGWERITTLSDFTGLHQLTSISAYSDTVICAYEHSYTNGNGIRYNISYNGGDSWGYGGSTFGPDVGHNLYFPDVTCRGGQGSAIVYDDEAGTFDPVWFRYRDHYSAGAWDAEVKQFNEHDGATGWPNRIEWVPPSAGSSYAYGAIYISWDPVPGTAWFDRSDGGSPVDPCECDLDNDGDCDMSDYFMFGEDWGRTDCP